MEHLKIYTMAKDFIPMADGKLYSWLNTFETQLSSAGGVLGLTAADILTAQQLCTEYKTQITQAAQAKASAKAAVAAKRKMRISHLQPLRKIVKRMKTLPDYSPAIGAGMNVLPHAHALDTKQYKPKLTARFTDGLIEIRFKKKGIDALEFWGQINDGEWTMLATRMHSPYHFRPENYPLGSALKCKFKAMALVKDNLIGQWSDISTVLYEVMPTG